MKSKQIENQDKKYVDPRYTPDRFENAGTSSERRHNDVKSGQAGLIIGEPLSNDDVNQSTRGHQQHPAATMQNKAIEEVLENPRWEARKPTPTINEHVEEKFGGKPLQSSKHFKVLANAMPHNEDEQP